MLLHRIPYLALLLLSHSSYLPTSQVDYVLSLYNNVEEVLSSNQELIPDSLTITSNNPIFLDNHPLLYDSYDYPTYPLSKEDSYAGLDSYGVPVGDPITAPQDSYSYPTATGPGYVTQITTITEDTTEQPEDTEEQVVNSAVLVLSLFLFVVFLWPVTIFVNASDVIGGPIGVPIGGPLGDLIAGLIGNPIGGAVSPPISSPGAPDFPRQKEELEEFETELFLERLEENMTILQEELTTAAVTLEATNIFRYRELI